MSTSTITLRMNEDEKLAVSSYARSCGMTVSEFARSCMLEKIEDEYDLQAIEEYEKEKATGTLKTRSLDDVLKDLDL